MSDSAVLISYGSRGSDVASRARELAQPGDTIRAIDQVDAIEDALTSIAQSVSGHTSISAIHVIDAEDDTTHATARTGLAKVAEVAPSFPGLVVRQFVVALVGQEWDDDELVLLEATRPGGLADGLVVVGRSNEAAALSSLEDEHVMASDVIYALLTTDLSIFGEVRNWTAGATAVYYRRKVILAAIAAWHTLRFLTEALLAPRAHDDPYGGMGRVWVREMTTGENTRHSLSDKRHRDLLEQDPVNGSVFADLRLDRSGQAFRRTPLELLSDALRSYVEQVSAGALRRAFDQIDRNRDAHLERLVDALREAAHANLDQSQNFAATEAFLDNVDAELGEVEHQLLVEVTTLKDELPEQHEKIRHELERAIRKLPYPAAVAVRTLAFGAVGLGVFYLFVAAGAHPWLAPAGLAFGALVSTPLWATYLAGRARIRRLQERYLRNAEERLLAEARLHVVGAILDEVRRLRTAAIGESDSVLAALKKRWNGVRELGTLYERRVADRHVAHLTSTRFSTFMPRVGSHRTEDLARQFPAPAGWQFQGPLVRALIDGWIHGTDFDLDHADQTIVTTFEAPIGNLIWQSLSVLLSDAPATLASTSEVLGSRVLPLMRRDDFIHQEEEIRRLLFIDNKVHTGTLDYLRGRVEFHGSQPSTLDDEDAILLLSLRAIPSITTPGTGE